MSLLHFEPFHLGAEQIVHLKPTPSDIQEVMARSDLSSVAVSVMLDDTHRPGTSTGAQQILSLIGELDLPLASIVRETDLTPIALSLLTHIPDNNLRFERNGKVWFVGTSREFTLVKFSEGNMRKSKRYIARLVEQRLDPTQMYQLIMPTCSLFVVGWNVLRLSQRPDEIHRFGINSEDRLSSLANLANAFLQTVPTVQSNVLNLVPDVFRKNEQEALSVIKELPILDAGGRISNGYYQ